MSTWTIAGPRHAGITVSDLDRSLEFYCDVLGMRLLRKPIKPQWATRVGVKVGPQRKLSWERFLEEAYWNVELKE